MSGGDLSGEMRFTRPNRFGSDLLSLSDDTVDRLLSGLEPDDAPPAYRRVAARLGDVRDELGESVTGPDPALVAAMAAEVLGASTVADARREKIRRRPMLKLVTAKIAVLTAGGLLAASGVAAAATGALPGHVQDVVSDAVSHVGVSLPTNATSDDHTKAAHDTESEPDDKADSDTSDSSDHEATKTSSSTSGSSTVTCPADVQNHGQFVSSVAHDGGDVQAAAQSDCGKKPHDESAGTDTEQEKPEARESEDHKPATAGQSSNHSQSANHGKPATAGSSGSKGHDSDDSGSND